MEIKKLKLTFAGGTGWVTGANFLLETIPEPGVEPFRILIDCGLIQGGHAAELENWNPFPYDPKKIDVLIVSHAHTDHIGRIPKLVYEGFKGRIIGTSATADLTEVMLEDTANILSGSKERDEFNLKKMYSPEILDTIKKMWETHSYHENFTLNGDLHIKFKDAGHILGSAMTEITYNGSKIVFTGDLGNSPSPLLNDTEDIHGAKYLVMESVYGDRNHEERTEREENLKKIILDTYNRNGVLMVPIFSVERTQEFLYELNNFVESKQVPKMKIFLDSPLAIKVTDVFRKHLNYLKDTVKMQINQGDNIFHFPGLKETELTKDSIKILKAAPPKIILAGSGMSTGGRILHHEKNYLSDPNATLLISGYQVAGTLGRLLQEGRNEVMLFHERVHVKAKIAIIQGYSGHKDSFHLVKFVEKAKDSLKKVFIVMGEPHSSMFLAQKINDHFGIKAVAPELYDSVELEF
jgi:metallo-beta-lactamase family protein